MIRIQKSNILGVLLLMPFMLRKIGNKIATHYLFAYYWRYFSYYCYSRYLFALGL